MKSECELYDLCLECYYENMKDPTSQLNQKLIIVIPAHLDIQVTYRGQSTNLETHTKPTIAICTNSSLQDILGSEVNTHLTYVILVHSLTK